MARVTTTRYLCDSCGREVDRPRDLRHFRVVNDGLGGRDSWQGEARTQLCSGCVRTLHDALDALGLDLSELIEAEALAAA